MNPTMQLPDMMIRCGHARTPAGGLKPGRRYRVQRGKFKDRVCVYVGPHALPSNSAYKIAGEWSGRARVQFIDTKREAVIFPDALAPIQEAEI
jgi:hypothetical protein